MTKLETIFENENIIVVNKPAGWLVIPDRSGQTEFTVKTIVEKQLHQKLFVVHRLDRDTSGVLCFAKNEESHRHLSLQFQNHQTEKYYQALALGRFAQPKGSIENHLTEHHNQIKMMVTSKGKWAKTDYEVLEQWPLMAHLQLQIFTGRLHQIRVHLKSIGHPLVGDKLYGDGQPFLLSSVKKKYHLSEKKESEKPLLDRVALHANKLIIKDLNDARIIAEAPLPKDMQAVIKQLHRWTPPTLK